MANESKAPTAAAGQDRTFLVTCRFALNAESMATHADLNIAEIPSESGAIRSLSICAFGDARPLTICRQQSADRWS
jgi:hypothetical protein